jgi:hypothetical protein
MVFAACRPVSEPAERAEHPRPLDIAAQLAEQLRNPAAIASIDVGILWRHKQMRFIASVIKPPMRPG